MPPTPRRTVVLSTALAVVAAGALVAGPVAAAPATGSAPGYPGKPADWSPGDKDGFGTSRSTASKVWYTLNNGTLSEVFAPRIDTPASRDTQLVITDGATFADREDTATKHRIRLLDARGLVYQQVDTATSGRYRITKTYVTDPRRSAVLVDVRFESLTGKPYSVYVLHDVGLGLNGNDDTGRTSGGALVATDGVQSSSVRSSSGFTATSSGYLDRSDGWTDLNDNKKLDWAYTATRRGNVVQVGRTRLTGLVGRQSLTLSLGFGVTTTAADDAARGALTSTFGSTRAAYAAGWHRYLDNLPAAPRSAAGWRDEYDVSVLVLAASEDKTYRGGFVASPGKPWAWANELQHLPVYHEVWSRDQYQIATALLAAGDRAAATRALAYLWRYQQRPDGSFPQNSRLDGEPVFGGLQLDEVAFPIVLARQLHRFGPTEWARVRRSADFIVANGPSTPQERWENIGGWSPATIGAEIAGLVSAADIAQRNGDTTREGRYLATADTWRGKLSTWTVTRNGPLSASPYFLRITADGKANAGTKIQISDGGPLVDQRRILDPSFLELVRLGVLSPGNVYVRNTLPLVDRLLSYSTANGRFWHRASYDGYGEKRDGSQWAPTDPGSRETLGRGWPLLTGERGEYALLNGSSAQGYLNTMARAADPQSLFMAEQVWDHRAPVGTSPTFRPGENTFSATPLAWTHAQFVRLARSIDAGLPVETPRIVACRYHGPAC